MSSRFGLANTGLCPPALGFVEIPALGGPCVATAGLSFKITVESSLVSVSWGSACSDYPGNPRNVRLASRPWEKIWACDLFILISLLIDSSLPKYPPAGNFKPDFLLFISATLNNLISEGVLPQQSAWGTNTACPNCNYADLPAREESWVFSFLQHPPAAWSHCSRQNRLTHVPVLFILGTDCFPLSSPLPTSPSFLSLLNVRARWRSSIFLFIFNALWHKYSVGHRQRRIDPRAVGRQGHSRPEFNLPNWSMETKTSCKRQTALCAMLCHSLALRARGKPKLPWRCWLVLGFASATALEKSDVKFRLAWEEARSGFGFGFWLATNLSPRFKPLEGLAVFCIVCLLGHKESHSSMLVFI